MDNKVFFVVVEFDGINSPSNFREVKTWRLR